MVACSYSSSQTFIVEIEFKKLHPHTYAGNRAMVYNKNRSVFWVFLGDISSKDKRLRIIS